MNTDLINPNEQRLLQLYAILAKKVFVAIRYLSAGRTSLYHETLNPALHHLSHEQLLMNLTAIGQLSEALHNLPVYADDRNDCAYTLRCLDRFVALQPELADKFDFVDLLRQIRELDPDIDALMFENRW